MTYLDYDAAMGVQHPEAYEAAIRRNIMLNARKTWERNTPDADIIAAYLDKKGTYMRETGYIPELAYTDNFFGSLAKALNTYGKLTPNQCEAVRKCMAKDQERQAGFNAIREARKALSGHIGTVGERIDLTLTIAHIVEIPTDYGLMLIHIMSDANQNRVIYKGSKRLADKGETVTLKATIKDHGERDGEKQTIIARPTIKA